MKVGATGVVSENPSPPTQHSQQGGHPSMPGHPPRLDACDVPQAWVHDRFQDLVSPRLSSLTRQGHRLLAQHVEAHGDTVAGQQRAFLHCIRGQEGKGAQRGPPAEGWTTRSRWIRRLFRRSLLASLDPMTEMYLSEESMLMRAATRLPSRPIPSRALEKVYVCEPVPIRSDHPLPPRRVPDQDHAGVSHSPR